MKNNQLKFHSLSRRIVAQFCIFSLVMSGIFGLLCFTLLYTLEDNFIEREVVLEADFLVQQYQKSSKWLSPRRAHMSLHFSKQTLPEDMKQKSIEEPRRIEFYGEQGRHYHLYKIPEMDTVYLLAEVSQNLLVRPVREGVLILLGISGLLITLVACVIAWLLGRKTAKPLKALADLVDGVAPEQIPDKFAHQFPNNEIGILAHTLEHSMQQISKALERERCFTRDVSHELRTPVAIIKNAVELYQQKNGKDNADHEIINRIEDASMQMEQTVTTLLHLAREEQAGAQKEPVELISIIEQSIIQRSYLLDGKSVEVEVDDNCHTTVNVQLGMLKVLLDNLLSNAFQYTNEGSVTVQYLDQCLIISDTGSGIEPEISSQVTEPAVKGSQSTGYGFGLSIVKRLCEHQQWQLSVSSEPNSGTRISVKLS